MPVSRRKRRVNPCLLSQVYLLLDPVLIERSTVVLIPLTKAAWGQERREHAKVMWRRQLELPIPHCPGPYRGAVL